MKVPSNWEKFQGIENHLSFYRCKKYPNFQLVIDWDREHVKDFFEEWMSSVQLNNIMKNASYFVRLEVNGMLLDKELFASLDGHRYFVPVPRIDVAESGEYVYYYDSQQIQLANIIGLYNFGDCSIVDFVKNQHVNISLRI